MVDFNRIAKPTGRDAAEDMITCRVRDRYSISNGERV